MRRVLPGVQALAMRLDLQLSTDQERQLLESCVLHPESSQAVGSPRRSSRSSHPGGPGMRRSASGPLRSSSGQLWGTSAGHSVLERSTSFGRQASFYNMPTPPASLPAIQACPHENIAWQTSIPLPPASLPALETNMVHERSALRLARLYIMRAIACCDPAA